MLTITPFETLSAQMSGRVVTPSDPDWDATRQVFNMATDLSPAAVALPHDVRDVVAAVDYARDQRPPRGAAGNGPQRRRARRAREALLVDVRELQEISIDVDARRVRVGAGVKWGRVAPQLSEHGLAALHGSSPDVGDRRLLAGRRHGLARPKARPPGEQRHRDRARHRGRARDPRRRRARARSLLGAARRQRQLRRRHGDRVRRLSRSRISMPA